MKKVITTLSLIALSLFGFGQQSLAIWDMAYSNISGTIFPITLPPNSSVGTELLVKNTDGSAHTYKCRRTIYTIDVNDSTKFCWGGLCYGVHTSLSSLSLTIASGDTVDFAALGFHATFISGSANITRYVHYQFYDIANVTDSTGVTLQYNSTLGVEDVNKIGGSISNAFPNPANSIFSVDYDVNEFSQKGNIVLYDMLGKAVKQIILSDKKGTAKINVDDLNAGVYFCSFVVDGKAISTRKIIVSSK